MKKILSSNKGFSLIELIVVIAILGVLVGVAAPNLIGYVDKTRVSADVANIENVKRVAEGYVAENYDTAVTDTTHEITINVKEAHFPDGIPVLKSKDAKTYTITVYVDNKGVVTVYPTVGTHATTGDTTFTGKSEG